MTLRLKRGTDAQRLAITFEEGELVYTTDTKKLFVGDGTTVGGVPVLSSGILDQDIDLNNYDIVGSGEISIVGDVIASRFIGDGSLVTGITVDQLANTNLVLPQAGETLVYDGVEWTNAILNSGSVVDGSNYRINIVGADSSFMIDTSNNTVSGTIETTRINTDFLLDIVNTVTPSIPLLVSLKNEDNQPSLKLQRTSNTDITSSELGYGSISFSKDDVNGEATTSIISATRSFLFMANDPSGSYADDKWLSISDGKFGIGTFDGTEKLTVAGNTVVDGFLKVGNISTVARDALTASNGMIIYNTTVNRLQGYQNSSWINLDDGSAA